MMMMMLSWVRVCQSFFFPNFAAIKILLRALIHQFNTCMYAWRLEAEKLFALFIILAISNANDVKINFFYPEAS